MCRVIYTLTVNTNNLEIISNHYDSYKHSGNFEVFDMFYLLR